MKLSDYAKKLGLSYITAYRHFRDGKIPNAYKLPSGTIIVPDEVKTELNGKAAVYARVSSSQNKSNLETQAKRVSDFCAARGMVVDSVVMEIGSGLNDERPKLLKLLTSNCSYIVVEHRDRLTRFGFNYIQRLLESQGREVIVINEVTEDKDDLMQDLIAVITSFVARYYGRRRTARKTEEIIKALENGDNSV